MSRANARNNYHTKWIVCILEIAINEITMVNKDIFISFFHLFIFFFLILYCSPLEVVIIINKLFYFFLVVIGLEKN